MAKKSTTTDLLAAARDDMAAANKATEELGRQRAAVLLERADLDAVEKIDASIERQRRIARALADRVKLLEAETRREDAERIAKEQAALIERIEGKLKQRDQVGAELQATLAVAEQQFRKLIDLSNDAGAAWPWEKHAASAAALTPERIRVLVGFEIFRIGTRPFLGGRRGEVPVTPFPGGLCPDESLRGLPERIVPLTDALASASNYGSSFMRAWPVDPLPEIDGPAILAS